MSDHKNQPFAARLSFALQGLAHGLRTQASLKLQAVAGVLALLVLVVLRPTALWWALVLLASATVVAAELFNTAIEQLADELHPHNSPGIRIVKDCAAAGVLVAVLGALGVAVAFAVHLMRSSAGA
ncbi:MAG TPA: diacylglycerol kinase [Steroidobacteraceae bacterium]|nr:diacylglycerol kinase [Steroidobacteraceae bacterium]